MEKNVYVTFTKIVGYLFFRIPVISKRFISVSLNNISHIMNHLSKNLAI